jgi:hypothetical protein
MPRCCRSLLWAGLASPVSAGLPIGAGGAVQGRGSRIKVPGLDRLPDALDHPLGSINLLEIDRHAMQHGFGCLRFAHHAETQPHRPTSGPVLDQFVVKQKLSGRVANVLVTPRASGRFEVHDVERIAGRPRSGQHEPVRSGRPGISSPRSSSSTPMIVPAGCAKALPWKATNIRSANLPREPRSSLLGNWID